MNAFPQTPSPFLHRNKIPRTPQQPIKLDHNILVEIRKRFQSLFDTYIDNATNNILYRKQVWTKKVQKDQEWQERLNSNIKVCEEKTRKLGQTLAKEADELDAVQQANSELQYQQKGLIDKKESLARQAEELENELHKIRALKESQRQTYQTQFSRNESELRLFKDTLKLDFHGIAQNVTVFEFKCINENHPERIYSFEVDYNERDYKGTNAFLVSGELSHQSNSNFFLGSQSRNAPYPPIDYTNC